ncbi:MAG: T9SS type A sorting domain-containing protein [Salibacter sp.]|uniref:T9SS type A sorting domain-containing protein n=1 Tax=Salibacter sp. TaxID=2010995 RepID=UPI00286FE33C|nr:T9SS type A sorting domain-containing protein [Salibacter sp.]MDR9399419.1 T9SS type A sorting domain-containing protein [Salibacter sp.]
MKNLFFLPLLFLAFTVNGQSLGDYQKIDSTKVLNFGVERDYPWAGGFNNPQFSSIDLNKDGFDDIAVFDKTGDRVYTFLNEGVQGQADYTYAPEYEKFFPDTLRNMMLMRDMNCNGKMDIFTQRPNGGGIRVYENVTPQATTDSLSFELAYQDLEATFSGGQTFVYLLSSDIPIIEDMDGDGDLDIVSGHNFGTYFSYYENVAPNCDTLIYDKVSGNACWAGFFENIYGDVILNDSFCQTYRLGNHIPPLYDHNQQRGAERHAGSALSAFDLNADGLMDVVLSDVDRPGVKGIFNGGTPDSAYMVSVDTAFPANSLPVDLPNMSAIFFMDVNNDGLEDFIAGPTQRDQSKDVDNAWLYINTGTSTNPVFTFNRKDFLSRQMIDHGTGSYPKFIDVDKDGLKDILVGNTGYFQNYNSLAFKTEWKSQLAYFKNTGDSITPKFDFITDDFESIGQHNMEGLYPAFGDLDGDGDLDMLAGKINGEVAFFRNTSPVGAPMQFTLVDSSFMKIQGSPYFTPELYDLDSDGDLDIIAGNNNGSIDFYENIGNSTSPQFQSSATQQNLGGVFHKRPAYPGNIGLSIAPFPTENSSEKLIVSTYEYGVFVYDFLNPDTSGNYPVIDSMMVKGRQIAMTGDVVTYANDSIELVYGEKTGGLTYLALPHTFQDTTPIDTTPVDTTPVDTGNGDTTGIWINNINTNIRVDVYPNPTNDVFYIDVATKGRETVLLSIYDIKGVLVKERRLAVNKKRSGEEFDLSGYDSGVYLIRVLTENGVVTKRITKK